MPAKRDKSGRWRYRKWIQLPDGRRKRISGTPATNTKAAAEAEERRHIRRILEPESVREEAPVREAPTVDEYAEKYLETRTGKPDDAASARQILLAYISPWFGAMSLDQITQADVDAFKVAMLNRKRPLSPKTVNNITSVLSRIVKYGVRNRIISDPGILYHVDSQDPEVEAVPAEDVERLLASCTDPRYTAAILLAYEAGLRIGEIRGLRWGDIDELHRELAVVRAFDKRGNLGDTKGRRKRLVPITSRLWNALASVPRRGPWCIARLADGKHLSYWATRDAIADIYERAGIKRPRYPWHCIRHSFCTGLAEAGVAPHLIQDMAGHQSFATTLRYIDPTREAKRAAVSKAFGQHMGKRPRSKKAKPRKP